MDKRSKKLGGSETSKIDFTKKALQKSVQNSCIAFYCQKFKGGLLETVKNITRLFGSIYKKRKIIGKK